MNPFLPLWEYTPTASRISLGTVSICSAPTIPRAAIATALKATMSAGLPRWTI